MRDEVTEFEDCECIYATEKACLVVIPELSGKESKPEFKNTGKFWIPQWAIHSDSEVYKRDTEGTLIVLDRFAEKELG
jgi:hypothetical protein